MVISGKAKIWTGFQTALNNAVANEPGEAHRSRSSAERGGMGPRVGWVPWEPAAPRSSLVCPMPFALSQSFPCCLQQVDTLLA